MRALRAIAGSALARGGVNREAPGRRVLRGLVLLLVVLGFAAAPVRATGPAGSGDIHRVTTATLAEVLVDLERRAPAEVRPLNDSLLAAEVSAVVRSVHADVGQRVQAGDLLVALDDADYRLALARSEAELASARARREEAMVKLERARTLGQGQYVSADELLERETALSVADAAIRTAEVARSVAQRNLARCRVAAPFDGAVAERTAQVGAYVNPGSPLLRLVQTDRFELDAEIPADQIESLLAADSIEFLSRGERWPLRLLRASPVIATARRARRARFEFTGAAPAVGRSGEVLWRVARGQLPASLVSRRGGTLGVFLLEGSREAGRAVFHPLPGAQEGRPTSIDLPPDREVILQGRERLQDGDAVTALPLQS